jgi:hypothetical protein
VAPPDATAASKAQRISAAEDAEEARQCRRAKANMEVLDQRLSRPEKVYIHARATLLAETQS